MRIPLILLVLSPLLATVLAPTSVRAAETIRFAQDDETAGAFFSSTDPSGCVLTEVSVVAVDGKRTDGPGPGEELSEVVVTISRYDQCADALLLAAEGRTVLAPAAFQIDGLESASLDTALKVFDWVSGTALEVDVALTWQGVGEPLRHRIHTHLWTRGFSLTFRFDGTDRPASASGTVTDGTTNFTPEPGVDNALWSIQAGKLTIVRN